MATPFLPELRPEIWAGPECTVNRVGDNFFDQVALTGHAHRRGDLDLLASLGAKAVRYPVLWERTAPDGVASADWAWADDRLTRLRELGLRPIVGLVHHGSGPRYTSLVDSRFPEKLAEYARAVAERFPFIQDWTPINEVVTTGRFSGLYGLWFPHGRDSVTFVRTILNQCRGVVLAMREVRKVNPAARLVQTEDLGRVSSTPLLGYQATFENRRRLLALDLLFGRVNRDHPLREHLLTAGATVEDLAFFEETPCPPDVVGVNYYLTSDRFLDHRVEHYPSGCHGGNGRQRYADVESVRVSDGAIMGHEKLLRELWARYRTTLAITEVHVGCTREEQIRWFSEAWSAAVRSRAAGVDVAAVTAWAAFGSYDWDKLVVRMDGRYEPGLFDVRSEPPRPTALARLISGLARGGTLTHPMAASHGWWRRPSRVLYRSERAPAVAAGATFAEAAVHAPLLIAGAHGHLGRALARGVDRRGLTCRLMGRADMDIADSASVRAQLQAVRPAAVINAAGYSRIDDAETDRERCWRDNVSAIRVLTEACRDYEVPLVTFSSDLVFSGQARSAYTESSAPSPLGVYGSSQALAETIVQETWPRTLVIRTAAFFGAADAQDFVSRCLRALTDGRQIHAADDLVHSPTYLPDLVDAALDLLIDGAEGVWHLANRGQISWADLARAIARRADLDESLIVPCPAAQLGLAAPRPPFSALDSERGRLMRPLDEALGDFMSACGASAASTSRRGATSPSRRIRNV